MFARLKKPFVRICAMGLPFFATYAVCAQETSNKFLSADAIQIINSLFPINRLNACLLRRVDSWHLSLVKHVLAEDTVLRKDVYEKQIHLTDTVTLTSMERSFVDSAFAGFEKFQWFEEAMIELNFYIQPTAADVINKGKRFGFPLCTITPPVFLRNEKLSLVYYSGESHGSLFIYKKGEGGWKKKLEILLWQN